MSTQPARPIRPHPYRKLRIAIFAILTFVSAVLCSVFFFTGRQVDSVADGTKNAYLQGLKYTESWIDYLVSLVALLLIIFFLRLLVEQIGEKLNEDRERAELRADRQADIDETDHWIDYTIDAWTGRRNNHGR